MMLRSSAWTAPAVAALQLEPLTTHSAISVGLMITIIGAVGWLSRVLTRSEEQLKGINEKLGQLRDLPERMALVENSVKGLEDDINNLWAEWRSDGASTLEEIRRQRGPRVRRNQ